MKNIKIWIVGAALTVVAIAAAASFRGQAAPANNETGVVTNDIVVGGGNSDKKDCATCPGH